MVIVPFLSTQINCFLGALRLPLARIRLFRPLIAFHFKGTTVNHRTYATKREANVSAWGVRSHVLGNLFAYLYLFLGQDARQRVNLPMTHPKYRVRQDVSGWVCFRFLVSGHVGGCVPSLLLPSDAPTRAGKGIRRGDHRYVLLGII